MVGERGRKGFGAGLLGICALGLALRLGAFALVPTQPVSDYWSYLRRGVNLLDTATFGVRPGQPDATWTPGYPLVLAAALGVSGRTLAGAKIANALLGVAAVGLAGLVGRRLAGERVGLAAAAVVAVLPRLVVLPVLLASENLFLPLVLLWMLIGAAGWEREDPAWRRVAAGGVVVALATLARAAGYLLWLAWPLAGLAAGRRWRRVALETAVLIVVQHAMLLPWAVRNLHSMGSFSFLTTSAGMTLYSGNNPGATGRWQRVAAAAVPPGAGTLRGFARDRLYAHAALSWMRANPRRAIGLWLIKAGLMLRGEGIVYMAVFAEEDVPRHALPRGSAPLHLQALPAEHWLRRRPAALAVPVALGYWLLTALEIGGLVSLLRLASRGPGAERARWRAAAVAFGATALYFVALGACFHGDPRFRWPASDVLAPVAGLSLVSLFSSRSARFSNGTGRAAMAAAAPPP